VHQLVVSEARGRCLPEAEFDFSIAVSVLTFWAKLIAGAETIREAELKHSCYA